jgi:hypothetical protein
MTLDITPGVLFRVRHQLPPCAQSAEWPAIANGARIEVEHVDFATPAPCEHVWIVHESGDFCDKCGAERSRAEPS